MGALTDLMPWFKNQLDDIPEGALGTGVMGDQLISVPLQLGTIVVLGMKENLKAVGLPEKIPDNWNDFKTAVKKISAVSDKHYGFAARTAKHPNSAFWFFPVMYGHGGEFEDASGKVVFDSPGNIAALSWYKEIGTQKQTPMGMAIPESRNLFAQGSVGFLFDGPWMLPIMRNQSGKGEGIDPAYTAAPFPKGPDGRRRGINNNHVLVVSKQSKVKDQAVTFIKYWTQDPEITDFHYEKMGAIPAYKSLQARPTYSKLHDVTKAAIEGAEYAEGAPSKNPQFSAALEFVAAALQAALLGGNPAEIAAQTDLAVRTLYGQ
jgi:multiple sugar transport system substrate-binding protein